jgi:ABC-2 type transport system permease protein
VREEPGESTGLINPDNAITSGLFELCFPFPGTIEPAPKSKVTFTKLVTTRELSGTIPFEQFTQYASDQAMLRALQKRREDLTIAALIETDPTNSSDADPPATGDEKGTAGRGIKVLYCCDLDLMTSNFLRVRAHPEDDEDVQWQFENVTFLLNAVDFLVGDSDYIEIRKRKPRHATLQVVESRVEEARLREFAKRVEFQNQYEEELREAQAKAADALEKYETAIRDLEKRRNEGEQITAELQEKTQRLNEQREVLGRRLEVTIERLQREREREVNHIRRDIDLEIQRTQFKYKFLAVAIPWIPPFLVGLVVFVRRRLREREGIEKSRLR